MTYMPSYNNKMLQEYYKEIVEEYYNWLCSRPKRYRFIKYFLWSCKEPDFSRFLDALEHYEGELVQITQKDSSHHR